MEYQIPTFEQLPAEMAAVRATLARVEELLTRTTHTAPVKSEEPLTIGEASKIIKLSVPTVYALCQKRAIPFSKRGKRLYFFHDELTEWLKAGRRKTLVEIEQNTKK